MDAELDDMRFAVVDVETSGLSVRRHHVLQIGLVVVDGNGRVLDRWSSLVAPRRRWWFRVGPVGIHGIRRQMVLLGAARPTGADRVDHPAWATPTSSPTTPRSMSSSCARPPRPTASPCPSTTHCAPSPCHAVSTPIGRCRIASAICALATASSWCDPTMRLPTPMQRQRCSPTCLRAHGITSAAQLSVAS